MRAAKLIPKLIAEPKPAKEMNHACAKNLFQQLPMGDCWDDAMLFDVAMYLRGSKSLKIPEDWRPVLPTELPVPSTSSRAA